MPQSLTTAQAAAGATPASPPLLFPQLQPVLSRIWRQQRHGGAGGIPAIADPLRRAEIDGGEVEPATIASAGGAVDAAPAIQQALHNAPQQPAPPDSIDRSSCGKSGPGASVSADHGILSRAAAVTSPDADRAALPVAENNKFSVPLRASKPVAEEAELLASNRSSRATDKSSTVIYGPAMTSASFAPSVSCSADSGLAPPFDVVPSIANSQARSGGEGEPAAAKGPDAFKAKLRAMPSLVSPPQDTIPTTVTVVHHGSSGSHRATLSTTTASVMGHPRLARRRASDAGGRGTSCGGSVASSDAPSHVRILLPVGFVAVCVDCVS